MTFHLQRKRGFFFFLKIEKKRKDGRKLEKGCRQFYSEKMSESGGGGGKTCSSSLVVVEKQKTQRPGGCVGIFFQLLDWNRRLAKKKLFSTKLLPPARAKRATKKFGGDDKLPMAKLLLIADENRGGFPNAPKCENDSARSHTDTERTREMRPPGLVARLMGLESMPERRDKPKKAGFTELYHEKRSKKNDSSTGFEHFSCDREDRNLEKGHGKVIESRPQKLQKTGLFERRQVTRFGAEALQLKSALSRSRKHHHSKLASPVKSPRVIPGRKSTRLMGAATRILEPGLQATNRAKYALTYSPFMVNSSKEDITTTEETSVLFPDQSEHQICYGSSTKSLKGQASCNSCGNLFDVMDFRSNSEEQMLRSAPSASESGGALFQGMVRKPPVVPLEQGRDVAVPKAKDHPTSLSAQTKASTRPRNENCSGRRLEIQESLDQRRTSSQNQHTKPRRDVTSSAVPKLKGPKQNQVSLAKDSRMPSRPKMSNLRSGRDLFADSSTDGAKDFVSLNRTSGSVTRTRTSPKVLDKVDMERNACIDKHDSPSRMKVPIRKGRPSNGTAEKAGFTQPTFGKRRNDVSSAVTGKGTVGTNACSVNDNRVLRMCSGQVPGNTAGDSKSNDVVSFTFSSPMRHNAESPSHAETIGKARSPEKLLNSSSSYKYELKRENSCSQMETLLSGDALGALLEEKLRELTSRDRDEWESGDDLPGRSTASILQDLISALTVGKLPSHEDKEKCLIGASQNGSRETPVGMSTPGQMFNANKKFRDTRFSDAVNSDHPSPGSVLEASFSNDSWFSDSFDGSSGNKLHPESMECSYSHPQLSSDPDADILDSATSLNTWMPGDYEMTGDLNRMSGILYGIDLADIGVEGSELKHIQGIIINTELLLGSAPLFDANDSEDFPSVLSLVHKLENLPTCNSFMDTKEGDLLRRFLFDYVIEWLDSKYSRYCKSGFKTWQKLPLHVTGDMLTREVSEEIGKCTNLAGKLTDEIIEKDMNHNLGKWTDFGIDEFGIGTEIEWEIFKSLVDEMVIELGQSRATGTSCRS